MKHVLSITTFMIAMAGPADAGDIRPDDYAYGSRLEVNGRAPLFVATIPQDVYRNTVRPRLDDICVVNGLNEVVPFALRRPAEKEEAAALVQLPLFPLQGPDKNPGEALKLRLRSGDTSVEIAQPTRPQSAESAKAYLIDSRNVNEPLVSLRVAWNPDSPDFAGRLQVEASDDLAQWRTVISGAPVANLHYAGQSFVRDVFTMPDVRAPYLRISWASPAPAVTITGVLGGRKPVRQEALRTQSKASGKRTPSEGEFEFDLGANVPVDRVNLDLPELNTATEVEFLARAGGTDGWQSVARARVYRLAVSDMPDLSNSPIAVPVTAARYWKVRVAKAGGGLGQGTPTLVASWLPDELLFVARGSSPFMLLYGNSSAAVLSVPTGSLVDAKGAFDASDHRLQPVAVTVGPTVELGGPARLAARANSNAWKRAVLWAVLILGVAILGAMAWRLAHSPSEPPAPKQ